MATIMPQSELLRRAAAYVNEVQKECPDKTLADILDEAGMRFNLSPLDSDSLHRLFRPGDATADPEPAGKAPL